MSTAGFFGLKGEGASLVELQEYFDSKNVKITPFTSDMFENVKNLLEAVGNVAPTVSEKDLELLLNALVNLSVSFTPDQTLQFLKQLGTYFEAQQFKGAGWNSNTGVAIRVLSNVFYLYPDRPAVRLIIFKRILELAGKARLTQFVDVSLETMNRYAEEWKLNMDDKRDLLRTLHNALIADDRVDSAFQVMTALLRTYTDVDAERAKDDACECVRTAIVDPKSFSVDHLLRLSAVQHLSNTDPKIYQILKLFSTGQLADFRRFVQANPNFVKEQLKVDEGVLEKKIKMLSLISMAETSHTLSMDKLRVELDIPESEALEEFLIDAIRIKAVNGKINEEKKEFLVTAHQNRTFGAPQWELLQKRLSLLYKNLKRSHEYMEKLMSGEPIEA